MHDVVRTPDVGHRAGVRGIWGGGRGTVVVRVDGAAFGRDGGDVLEEEGVNVARGGEIEDLSGGVGSVLE